MLSQEHAGSWIAQPHWQACHVGQSRTEEFEIRGEGPAAAKAAIMNAVLQ